MFPVRLMAVLLVVVVASLSLGGSQAECAGLSCFMGKLGKEWQLVDNLLREGASDDRINKYYADHHTTMESRTLYAFMHAMEAVNVDPTKTGCSESESLKVARLLDSLHISLNAETDRKASGVRKLAFEKRDAYGEICAYNYAEQLRKSIDGKLNLRLRSTMERFGSAFAEVRGLSKKDIFTQMSEGMFTGANLVTNGMMGRALYSSLMGWLSPTVKQINPTTKQFDFNWVEVVEGVRNDCKAYKGQVKGFLDTVAKDAVVVRAFAQLEYGLQIWRSWTATVACDQLENFGSEALAEKMAAAAAKSAKSARKSQKSADKIQRKTEHRSVLGQIRSN